MGVVEMEEGLPIFPVFEVELDLDKTDGQLRKAEVDANSGVHLRCKIKGESHDAASIQWLFGGSALPVKNGVEVETDHRNLVSNLKLNPVTGGIYECGVNSKTDGKLYTTRLKVASKPTSLSQSKFGENLCKSAHDGHCYNGGTCLYHPETNIVSCRCREDFSGDRCQYYSPPEVHKVQPTWGPICDPGTTQAEYQKSVILVAGFATLLIISLMIAFFLYVKKRDQIKSRFRRGRGGKNLDIPKISTTQTADKLLPDEDIEGPPEQPIWRQAPSLLDERIKLIKALVPARCPHCKRTLGINKKLDDISAHVSISSRNSTPPMLSYPEGHLTNRTDRSDRTDHTGGIRSVSESHFHVDETRNVNINRNQSTPGCYLRVTEFLTPRPRERQRGVSENNDDSESNRRRPVSTPVSPVTKNRPMDFKKEPSTSPSAPESDNAPVRFAIGQSEIQASVPSRPTGVIQEMSVDESGGPTDSTALLDALQAYRAQNSVAKAC